MYYYYRVDVFGFLRLRFESARSLAHRAAVAATAVEVVLRTIGEECRRRRHVSRVRGPILTR